MFPAREMARLVVSRKYGGVFMHNESWVKPQLVVFGRGRPEEQVLCACKVSCKGGPGRHRCGAVYGRDCRNIAKS